MFSLMMLGLAGCSSPQPPPPVSSPAPMSKAGASSSAAATSSKLRATVTAGPAWAPQVCDKLGARGKVMTAVTGAPTVFDSHDNGYALAVDAAQPAKVSVRRIAPDGAEVWRVPILNGAPETFYGPAPWPIVLAPDGDVVVAGTFAGVIEAAGHRLATPPAHISLQLQPFVVRLSPKGEVRWARKLTDERRAGVRGLFIGPDGSAHIGVTPVGFPAVSTAGIYRVTPKGEVSKLHAIDGALDGIAPLSGGRMAVLNRASESPHASTLRIYGPDGKVIQERRFIKTRKSALAATGNTLWVALDFMNSDDSRAALRALDIEVQPDTGSTALLKLTTDLELIAAHQLSIVGETLIPMDGGGVAVAITEHPLRAPSMSLHGYMVMLQLPVSGQQRHGAPERMVALGMYDGHGFGCLHCGILCQQQGRCSIQGTQCVATERKHCEASSGCRDEGGCTLKDGECIAATESDCAQSKGCKENGRCVAVDGQCMPKAQAHCARSTQCSAEGLCSYDQKQKKCIAASDIDCRRAQACREAGRCSAVPEGICQVKGANVCPTTKVCRDEGRCTLRAGQCEVGSDADCQQSRLCQQQGACTKIHGASASTRLRWCGLTSDADCKRSMLCKRAGQCRFEKRQCVK